MTRFGFLLVICTVSCIAVFGITGCRSNGGQPSNPFALNQRQTAPPPATFSAQAAYLGQTPGVYVPQSPATVYPDAATPTSPVGAPLPTGTAPVPVNPAAGQTTPAYGSLNTSSPSATLWQTAAAVAPAPAAVEASALDKTANAWIPAAEPASDVPIAETRQTAFQNLESKTNTIATVSADGTQTALTVQPEKLAVSSAQTVTKIAE